MTKSWVWKFCAKYPETIENSQDIALCTICREIYKNNSKAKTKIWEIKIGSSSSTEHLSRGFRQIRNGIPLQVFLAAACDPRTKDLGGIPDLDQKKVWEALKNEILANERTK